METSNWTNPNEALNALQDNGIVSDLCQTLDDVAQGDVERAEKWLSEHQPDAKNPQ